MSNKTNILMKRDGVTIRIPAIFKSEYINKKWIEYDNTPEISPSQKSGKRR